MPILAKYGQALSLEFPMLVAGSQNFAATGDWTPATGDTKISKDAGNVANTTNNPAAVGGTGSVTWSLTLTATEMQAARVTVQIVDSATKAVEDQMIVIHTYGHASALHAADLDDATALGLSRLDAAVSSRATQAQILSDATPFAGANIDAAITTRAAPGDAMDLVAGAVDAAAVAAGAIDADALAADLDTYQAKVWLIDDDNGTTDRYIVAFYRNGEPIVAGITSPTIQVVKASDGTDLVASTALTQVAALGLYKHDEAANRVVDGSAYFAKVEATIDSATRTWYQPVGRDS